MSCGQVHVKEKYLSFSGVYQKVQGETREAEDNGKSGFEINNGLAGDI